MRYGTEHKAATRQQVIETAARRFRADGIDATGIAALMAEAGLTHGGFYAHFPSKEALVQEAITVAMGQMTAKLADLMETAEAGAGEGKRDGSKSGGRKGFDKFLRTYLTPTHRDHPEEGCATAALATEIARHPAKTRHAFTRELQVMVQLIAAHLSPAMSASKRQDTALAIFSTLMGSLQLARAVSDPDLSRRFLDQGIAAARLLAGSGETSPTPDRSATERSATERKSRRKKAA
ncbi:MAG: TetR/AcrR family transcriptional regulator [Dongiaceae bacterium]